MLTGAGVASAAPTQPPIGIATVPSVPNFPVTLDGKTVLTDKDGIAHFSTTDRSGLTARSTLHTKDLDLHGQRVRVVGERLFVNGPQPRLVVTIFWRVQFSYLDIGGKTVDVGKIKSVRLKSSTGEIRRVDARQRVWLQGSRVVPLSGGLENKLLYWTVQEVDYASTNVVNASQQRFQPADTQSVPLKLLFYRTKVRIRDGFFGFGTGTSVLLTYPDKSASKYAVDGKHNATLPSLPRGNYTVVVNGPGPRMSRPVAISRDQVLDLKFYSWLDISLIVAFGVLFSVGTLLVGWRLRLAHRKLGQADGRVDDGHRTQGPPQPLGLPQKRTSERHPPEVSLAARSGDNSSRGRDPG